MTTVASSGATVSIHVRLSACSGIAWCGGDVVAKANLAVVHRVLVTVRPQSLVQHHAMVTLRQPHKILY